MDLLDFLECFLPFGAYNVTAYAKGFKPLTKKVTLTKESPDRELIFDFFESEPVDNFKFNTKDIPEFGQI